MALKSLSRVSNFFVSKEVNCTKVEDDAFTHNRFFFFSRDQKRAGIGRTK